jgi:hypothetical protein
VEGEAEMSALKRLAFGVGFLLGLAGFVVVAGNALLYLLTGKLPSVEVGEGGKPVLGLVTPQEIVALVREQVERDRGRRLGTGLEAAGPYYEEG